MKQLLLLVLTTLSLSAQAAFFDFAQIADGADYGDLSNSLYADGTPVAGDLGEAAYQELVWTVDGITLTASAARFDGATAWAYLDEISGGKPAGLGVCSAGYTATYQCTDAADDNVTFGEELLFSFDQSVNVDLGLSLFRDGDHNLHGDDHAFEYSLNGIDWTLATDANDAFQTNFFALRVEAEVSDLNKFYVDALEVTAVPEPATLALLGMGLLGLGTIRRKRGELK